MSAQLGVSVMQNSDRGDAFSHQKRKCPTLWGDFQEPLSRKGFLKLLSFGIFPLQKQRKVHKDCSNKEKYTKKKIT